MRPVEIRIAGSFYDSQIYAGVLYLWTTAGDILHVDWNRLVDSIETQEQYRATLEFAFRRSEYLYDPNVAMLLQDPEIRLVLQGRFRNLSESPLEITDALFLDCTLAKYANRFSFPHADTGFYNNNLFVGGREGVEYALSEGDNDDMRPTKLTDLPALGIALGSSRLAIAAGDEGAFQLTAAPDVRTNLRQVMSSYTNWVRWMESALFATDRSSTGTFVDFKPGKKDTKNPNERRDKVVRKLLSVTELREIHEHVDYVWGAEDRLCIATSGHVDVVKFFPRRKLAERFEYQGSVQTRSTDPQEVIAADSAVFGFILEHTKGLEVLTSSSDVISIDGEPVNWRVFPRSRYYTNHLHVLRDEHLSVLSFNDDFFVNQSRKLSGIEYKPNVRFGRTARFEGLELPPYNFTDIEDDAVREL